MCGIVGFVDNKEVKAKKQIIKKMADRIIHRGPDDVGYFVDKNIALGHRRLSIIDLKSGKQPIYNEDKSMVVIFNGEIYNYREIKDDLIKKGHKFTTETDTEVLIHGYEEYKTELFPKLRGMFAFVIYDTKTGELVGCRDHFGIKPFYYGKFRDAFMFGSEIKSFLEHPDFKKEVNTDALKMYLIFQYSIHEETFFKNVFKLKPGHYFSYKDGKLKIEEYFRVSYEKGSKSYKEYETILQETLEESIKYHEMTSDVEVGSYLSGGVDSSYVVSVAKPDKTFTVGFDYQGFDETKMAKELSDILGLKNYSKYISSEEFFNVLPTVVYHTDEPHANLSTVPLYFLARLASSEVKVVLSGEGSDEMFGGYNEYNEPTFLKMYGHLPLFMRKFNTKVLNKVPYFKGKNTIMSYGKPLYERYIGHGNYMSDEEANMILADNLKSDETIKSVIKPYYDVVKNESDVTKKMYIDMNFWLPQDILLKADKMSMASSLELRVPLLDIEVFKMSSQIPSKFLVKNKETKYIFRNIAHAKIPEEWSKRRKLGFPVPFGKYIREEKYYKIVKEYFNRDYVKEFFNIEYINKLLDDHYYNHKLNGLKVYIILIFIIWYEVYFLKDGNLEFLQEK